MNRKFLILGASNPEVIRLYDRCRERDARLHLLGFIDNDPAKVGEWRGFRVYGGYGALDLPDLAGVPVMNAITRDARLRHQTTMALRAKGVRLASLIHPSVDTTYVSLGDGQYVQENVVLQADVVLEDNVSIHVGTLVGHETTIGESSFVAHGCAISGRVDIGKRVFVGVGARILPRVRIGSGAVIGGGAVVIRDVPPNAVVVGNPARVTRLREPFSP